MMSEDTFTLAPTVLIRVHPDSIGTVTVTRGEKEALLVFRGPEDAWGYQRTTGKHTAAEDFHTIGMTDEALSAVLDKYRLSWVAMPEPWAEDGSAGVDLFTREGFFALLEDSEPA